MTQAIPVRVAVSIAEELLSHTFNLGPDVIERGYVQDHDLILAKAQADELRIDVQVGDCETTPISRETTKYVCRTDVLVRKHFIQAESDEDTGRIDTTEIDRIIRLVEEIHDYFARNSDTHSGRRLTTYEDAAFNMVEYRPLYFPEHLRENRQFTGIVAVTYQVIV